MVMEHRSSVKNREHSKVMAEFSCGYGVGLRGLYGCIAGGITNIMSRCQGWAIGPNEAGCPNRKMAQWQLCYHSTILTGIGGQWLYKLSRKGSVRIE
ncbi:hypothetical protein TNCV_3967811 [Trichonephila clavipes]|nr:hypothetical protein TNCV_3967811 [Trichonephila clavipes]